MKKFKLSLSVFVIICGNLLSGNDNAVCFYENINYGGSENCYEIGTIFNLGKLNDAFSSVKVPRGLKTTTFEHIYFQGKTVEYKTSTSYVGDDYDNKISSLTVTENILNVNDTIKEQSSLNKLKDLSFMKEIFQSCKIANVNFYDGYWLGNLDLPNNTSEIPTGSKLRVKTNAMFNISFKSKFNLERNTDYTLEYNGKTWDITRDFGDKYIPLYGLDFKESNSDLIVKKVEATVNGSWVGGDYNTQVDYISKNEFASYFYANPYTKVVNFEIKDGVIITTFAKYRVGNYERDAKDYNYVSVATSAKTPSYGIHKVKVTLGEYEPKVLNVNNILKIQNNLNQLNKSEF